jgi:hypothetical protein
MAPDDNRRSRQPGCGNQGQIAIEIECLSHLDTQFSQMLRQSPTASHRLQAIQTSAKAKLVNIIEAFRERAFIFQASQMNLQVG